MLGFIGGTGPEGRGLALRFALAGERIVLGSREADRAIQAAEAIGNVAPAASIQGALNSEAAQVCDIAFVVVPYAAQKPTLAGLREELAGKTVVVVVAPLAFDKGVARAVAVEQGSAAQEAQDLLPQSTIVGAFQNLSADELLRPEKSMDSDVIVCSDDSASKETVMKLAELIHGARAVDGGGLANSKYVEDFTALLININRIYKAHSMVKIVGI